MSGPPEAELLGTASGLIAEMLPYVDRGHMHWQGVRTHCNRCDLIARAQETLRKAAK